MFAVTEPSSNGRALLILIVTTAVVMPLPVVSTAATGVPTIR